jgi:ubiquinone/menaquinone biosynthesis C-methylase UbiE
MQPLSLRRGVGRTGVRMWMSVSDQQQLVPPENMLKMFGGPRAFTDLGEQWVGYFKGSCDLQPHEQILDVGCGLGRVAIPLAGYLNSQGRYEGLDVVPERIQWCQENIAPRWSNFNFRLAENVFNKASNPGGKMQAKDFAFPYGDEEFDFVFLISVFTHMLPEDVEHYLREIARVLKKGGRSVITYCLLNDESVRLVESGKSKRTLKHDYGDYRLESKEVPERLVAYREDFVLDLYDKVGLDVKPPIRYGRWSGRELAGNKDFMAQDLVLAYRPAEESG